MHDYLTDEGRKISKSSGAAVDPATLAAEYGTDALRWWLLRDMPAGRRRRLHPRPPHHPRQHDLANGIGNLSTASSP